MIHQSSVKLNEFFLRKIITYFKSLLSKYYLLVIFLINHVNIKWELEKRLKNKKYDQQEKVIVFLMTWIQNVRLYIQMATANTKLLAVK